MHGLALCAGIGGIELGLRLALGDQYRTVAYVEREGYCVGRLAALALQGALDEAPIWDDVSTFDGLPYRGRVDILSAGIPCQPFSQAGPRTGITDPRWLWPAVRRIVRDVRPGYVFLENSPQLRKEALAIILADLSRFGFDAEWDVFSAAEEGYPHRRKRLFLLAADADSARLSAVRGVGLPAAGGHTTFERDGRADVADAAVLQRPAVERCESDGVVSSDGGKQDAPDADLEHGDRAGHGAGPDCRDRSETKGLLPECAIWCAQSGVCVVDDGSAYRLDQLRAIGNAVVPAVAARAWGELMGRLRQ